MLAAASEIPSWLLPAIIVGVVAQFLWSSVVSVVLYKLTKNDRDVDAMERKLTETNDKLIAERFRVVTHSVANHAQQFTSQLDAMSAHVKDRDAAFTRLLEANPHSDLKVEKALNALRLEVKDSTVSTKDFEQLRAEHRQMRDQLSRIATVDDMRKLLQENRHGN